MESRDLSWQSPASILAKHHFSGKVALITGASQGIGLAIAQALAAEGCNLVIAGRKASTLKKAATQLCEYKVQVLTVVCDVRDEDAVAAMVAAAKKKFRRLDIVINNAGVANESLPVAKLPVAGVASGDRYESDRDVPGDQGCAAADEAWGRDSEQSFGRCEDGLSQHGCLRCCEARRAGVDQDFT